MHEFFNVLRQKNLDTETVVQLGSDFGRSPRGDGTGSDHGWMCVNTSLFSGAFKGPMVLGNCRSTATNFTGTPGGTFQQQYPGSWGVAGKVAVDGIKTELGIGHMTSTVCEVLRIPPILANNRSLVREDSSGGFSPTIELARTNDE